MNSPITCGNKIKAWLCSKGIFIFNKTSFDSIFDSWQINISWRMCIRALSIAMATRLAKENGVAQLKFQVCLAP